MLQLGGLEGKLPQQRSRKEIRLRGLSAKTELPAKQRRLKPSEAVQLAAHPELFLLAPRTSSSAAIKAVPFPPGEH